MIFRANDAGQRLDKFLSEQMPDFTRSAIQKLLENGHVTVNGTPVKKNQKTIAGAAYTVDVPPAEAVEIQPEAISLDIAYEDADLIVINKPKDLVVHPAAGHWDGTLVNALLYHCGDSLSGINGKLRPGIVHRIDKDTSGLILAAKNDFAHQKLAAQLADHTMHRTYECIVCGNIRQDEGTIDAPIGRHPQDRKKMAVTAANGKPAITHYKVLARYHGYTHIQCRLETGRTHQIRVHLAWQNHPILGDLVYGHKKPELGQSTQCLHAREMTFLHPRTGREMTVRCDLPDYFQAVLEKLRRMG